MKNERKANPALLASTLAAALSCGAPPSESSRPVQGAGSSRVMASSLPARSTASASTAAPPPFRSDELFTLWIRGGDLIDGSGAKRRRADILVRKDRIAFVGTVDPSVRAERVVDASGAVVTPGFIDMHSHADPRGNVEPALAQGVTTVVLGQDGVSPSKHIGAWLRTIDDARPRVNVATLVGHATAREVAELGLRTSLTGTEKERLGSVVETAMKEGAFGLSTGLEYDPGRMADASELAALAKPVGDRHGVIMSHLRSEDDDKIEASLDELLEQGRASGARVHVAHIKVVYGHGEKRADEILAKLAAARAEGIEVSADIYPYTASYTTIGILFPDYARNGYEDAKTHKKRELLAYLHDRVNRRNGPEATLFGTGDLAGKTLAEVAKSRGVPFERVLFDLGPNGAAAAYFVMDDALQTRLFTDPFVSVGTDGGGGDPHPRGYGSFTRVIEDWVQKRGVVTLEEAVRKMTGLAAATLGLAGDRGCLEPGCAADVTVFVPDELHTRADFAHPRVESEGMRAVVVNGVVERDRSGPTKGRAGHALGFGKTAKRDP